MEGESKNSDEDEMVPAGGLISERFLEAIYGLFRTLFHLGHPWFRNPF